MLPALSLSPVMGPRSSWKDLEGSTENRSWDEAHVGFRSRAAQIALTFPQPSWVTLGKTLENPGADAHGQGQEGGGLRDTVP